MKTDKKEMNEKPEVAHYELQDLWPIALIFVFLGVAIPYGMSIQSDVKQDFTVDSIEYNATVNSQKAVAKIPAKSVTLVGIVLAVVVLAVLGRMMYLRAK